MRLSDDWVYAVSQEPVSLQSSMEVTLATTPRDLCRNPCLTDIQQPSPWKPLPEVTDKYLPLTRSGPTLVVGRRNVSIGTWRTCLNWGT